MKRLIVSLAVSILFFICRTADAAAVVVAGFSTVIYEITNFDGSVLSGGLPTVEHDGTVVQLGYYAATLGGSLTWTPLTGEGSANADYANSTIGDDASVQIGDGMFDSIWQFTVGDPTTGQNLPLAGTPLRIRFYNAKTIAEATHLLEVFNPSWLWRAPRPAGPDESVLAMTLFDNGTQMTTDAFSLHGVDIPHATLKLTTNVRIPELVPEPTSLSLLAIGLIALAARRQ